MTMNERNAHKIWQTKFEKILDDDERAKRPKIWQTKFEKFWMTMSETLQDLADKI